MTTSLQATSSQTVSRAAPEDSGCLVQMGYFTADQMIPAPRQTETVEVGSRFTAAARPAIEDSGCLVAMGFFQADAVIPASSSLPALVQTQPAFATASRPAPADSGCLEAIGIFIPKEQAKPAASTRVLALA